MRHHRSSPGASDHRTTDVQPAASDAPDHPQGFQMFTRESTDRPDDRGTGAAQRAGAGRRLVARVIDACVAAVLAVTLGFLTVVATLTLGPVLGVSDGTLSTLGALVLLFALVVVFLGPFVVSGVVAVAAGALGQGAGRTIGRRVAGIAVVSATTHAPSRRRAALHGALGHLPTTFVALTCAPAIVGADGPGVIATLGLVVLAVDLLAIAVRSDDRALHDVLAGVQVVRRPRRVEPAGLPLHPG